MSYEYNSESKRLDLPNPFKIENYFYLMAAAIMFLSAIGLLLISRSAIASHASFLSYLPFIIGVFLLVQAINFTVRAFSQLRFFFGRGEPKSLADEVSEGKGTGADGLKETLRQNALVFKEPVGALNGLLYSWIPNLIFAPLPIQAIAQRQFYNSLAIIMIFLSLMVSWISIADPHSSAWMGLFFYALTLFIVIKPLNTATAEQSTLGAKGLVGLILIAVMGPVLLPLISANLPDISVINLSLQALLLLVLSFVAITLFFIALTKQLFPPPTTTNACKQESLSMNSHPKQLLDELDRELQKNWTEQVPNRRYSKTLPIINNGTGNFLSELLEESQPMPSFEQRAIDLNTAFKSPRYQWLVWLNTTGVLLTCAGVITLIIFAVLINPLSPDLSVISYLTLGIALLILSSYCFSSGHALWGRFDFVSKLTCIEMQGNYQSAKLNYGNTLTDRIKTEKNVINIENMTLRVWVSELETVSFGKNSTRWIAGMRGLPDESSYLAKHLTQFAANQSIIVAPESTADLRKIANLAAINQLGGAASSGDINKAIALQTIEQVTRQNVCTNCNEVVGSEDKFCGFCGAQSQSLL